MPSLEILQSQFSFILIFVESKASNQRFYLLHSRMGLVLA